MLLIDAPARGTGKGLLSDLLSIIALGHVADVGILPKSEEEVRKGITSLLIDGRSMIHYDNVTEMTSSNLCAVLTTTRWTDRILSHSKMASLPNQATWIATGNNVALSDEMARRVVLCRLNANEERPEERKGFRHELPGWALAHRPELISACLSMVSAWATAGRPEGTEELGRFESWAHVLGGILKVAEVPGFLENRNSVYAADAEVQEWAVFCTSWWQQFGDRPVTAKELFEIAKSNKTLLTIWAGRSELGAYQRIGKALLKHRDRVFGRYVIRRSAEHSSTGNNTHRLELLSSVNDDPV